MDLVPVEHDPFTVPTAPVDYDPFATAPVAKPGKTVPATNLAVKMGIDAGAPQRNADLIIDALGPLGDAGMTVGDWLRTRGSSFDPRDIAPVLAGTMLGVAAPGGMEAAPAERAVDLAMDEASRLARAKAMGFRPNMPLFHGSGVGFTSFRGVPTSEPGMVTPGVSTALDPAVANEFADATANPQVYPLWHRAERPAVLTLDGSESHGEVVGALRDAFEAGNDAVMLKNYTTPAGKGPHNIIVVRDANQLRSPFAAFDPGKKFSPDLLAGVAAAGAVPVATLLPVDHDPFR